MKANYRLVMMAFVAGAWLGAPALAQSVPQNSDQSAPPPTIQIAPPRPTAPPSRDTVGPSELQNFSLGGTVTRPAEGPASTPPASTSNRNAAAAARTTASPADARRPSQPTRTAAGRAANTASPQAQATAPAFTPDLNLPTTTALPTPPPVAAPAPADSPDSQMASPSLAPSRSPSIVPWLLAALLLAGGLGILIWRRRPRQALAGALELDSYAPAEPPVPPPPVPVTPRVGTPPLPSPSAFAPAPAPASAGAPGTVRAFAPSAAAAPAPAPAAPPQPVGIVSTRLRPWLDVTMVPMTCQLDNQQAAFEFEIEVFNSGAAPARDITIAATLLNAGPNQDQEIAAFLARPIAESEPLPPLPPLQRITFRTSLAVQRASLQVFEAAGRQVFVPVLAFNALYRWSGGAGQTAGSSLVGRDTGAEKLAPLRADAVPRAFGGLGARPLPMARRL